MNKTKKIVITGMMAAVVSVLSVLQIPTPTGVPITLQTFTMALAGYSLGAALGAASTAIYVLLGLIGIPVFAGFVSGPGVLFGPTGGFIFGFIILAAVSGLSIRYSGGKKGFVISIIAGILGLTAVYILGALQYAILANISFLKSFSLVALPFAVKDILSVIAADLAGSALRTVLSRANLMEYKKA